MTAPAAPPQPLRRVDMHMHVGQRGDRYPEWGRISERLRGMRPVYDIFLLYAGVKRGEDTDANLEQATLRVLDGCRQMDRVVCLALDHVWDEEGRPRQDLSDFWVANEYVLHLRDLRPEKVLFGASVHPYRRDFEERVQEWIAHGAVFIKWLPSAQQFTLESPRVRAALKVLATAKAGQPMPVLIHTGVEYAVPTTVEATRSYDFLSWGFWDGVRNRFRKEKWRVPNVTEIRRTLDGALKEGAVIILAHAGLPYFAAHAQLLEHDDLPVVTEYLKRCAAGQTGPGRVYTDLSACVTPFRRRYFDALKALPADLLLFGTDFPVPVFELSAGFDEAVADFKAMLSGDFWRVAVPQDNLIDVSYRELNHFFPGHPMFTNFDRFLW